MVKHQPMPISLMTIWRTASAGAAIAHLTKFEDAAAVDDRSWLRSVMRVLSVWPQISPTDWIVSR